MKLTRRLRTKSGFESGLSRLVSPFVGDKLVIIVFRRRLGLGKEKSGSKAIQAEPRVGPEPVLDA